MSGSLYLIPSFIGLNHKDTIASRNLEVIYSIKHFIVEREKTARAFLKAIEHPSPQSELSFHELNKHEDYDNYKQYFNAKIQQFSIGLISEAGLPAVADPGSKIVAYAHQNKVQVRPLSGSSSIFLALMASGLNGQEFSFHGYLPIDQAPRIKKLKQLEQESKRASQIFMETPYRNNAFLDFLIKNLQASTTLCVAANLESEDEQIISKKIADWKKEDMELHKVPCIYVIGQAT